MYMYVFKPNQKKKGGTRESKGKFGTEKYRTGKGSEEDETVKGQREGGRRQSIRRFIDNVDI